jgi:hypothetical protein
MGHSRLDIVIVNWNAGRLLEECVRSILDSALACTALDRVVVVDNGSSDGSADFLTAAARPLVLIANPSNRGFAAACNAGAAGSQADYLLFLNPDIVLDANTLEDAVAFMDRPDNAAVDVSGIRLRDTDGHTQRCCARAPTPGLMLAHSMGLDVLLPGLVPSHFLTEWDHQDTRDVPQVMGAFLLIRRAAFERLGGFDQRFFVYYEDVDLCRRVIVAGGRCVHNAEVSAVHRGGGTTNQIPARRQFYGARSRIQYAAKHFGRPAAALVAFAGLVLEPLARFCRSAIRRSASQMAASLAGAALLWADIVGRKSTALSANWGRKKGWWMALRLSTLRSRPPGRLSVLALTRYPRQGASSRLRFLAFLPGLAASGIDVTVSPFFDERYLPALYAGRRPSPWRLFASYARRLGVLLGARHFDAVWIEKEALPWLPLAVEGALLGDVPYVVDFDDAWFLRYRMHGKRLARALLADKLERLTARARAALVGNDVLAAWARSAGAGHVVELPTAVDLARYQPAAPHPKGPLRIGWIGSPSSAAEYLRPLAPMLAEVTAAGWATLTVVGAEAARCGVEAACVPWSEDGEIEELGRFDVGIMPLTDTPWSRGKCAYKLIQYMAVGIPVIASPVGMNRQVVRHGVNGFLAETADDWKAALRTLADDPELRRRMGEAGRRIVAEEFTLEVILPRLTAVLRAAAGGVSVAPAEVHPEEAERAQ